MKRADDVTSIAPSADAAEALRILGKTGFHQLPVVDGDGIVSRLRHARGRDRLARAPPRTAGASGVTASVKAALRWYLPVVIVAATLNLRPALLTLGLVLPAVQRSLALSPFGAGALTALPIFALGAGVRDRRSGRTAAGLERRPHLRARPDRRRDAVAQHRQRHRALRRRAHPRRPASVSATSTCRRS